jgi:hypothetical protein
MVLNMPRILMCCVISSLLLGLTGCGEEKKTETTTTTVVTTAPAASQAQAAATTPAPTGLADPFTYCATVGTIDKPDNRYTGQALPDNLIKAMVAQQMVGEDLPQLREPGFVSWRCMDKKVYACVVGANLPCEEKADTSTEPNAGMIDFCKSEPDSDIIPAAAAGRVTIYDWSCKKGVPVKGEQVTTVDAQGYPADYWEEVQATQ